MLTGPVVPHGDRVRLPAQSHLELGQAIRHGCGRVVEVPQPEETRRAGMVEGKLRLPRIDHCLHEEPRVTTSRAFHGFRGQWTHQRAGYLTGSEVITRCRLVRLSCAQLDLAEGHGAQTALRGNPFGCFDHRRSGSYCAGGTHERDFKD